MVYHLEVMSVKSNTSLRSELNEYSIELSELGAKWEETNRDVARATKHITNAISTLQFGTLLLVIILVIQAYSVYTSTHT